MKKGIHPKYYPEAVIKCSCGNVITTGSTKPEMYTEICSACHPFYTGKKKVIDTTGRVDRFKKRLEKSVEMKDVVVPKKAKLAAKAAKKASKKEDKNTPKTEHVSKKKAKKAAKRAK